MRRLAFAPALVLLVAACGAPPASDVEAGLAPWVPVPDVRAPERPTLPAPRPQDLGEPAPVLPVREVPFPCVPEGPAAAPVWTVPVDAYGVGTLQAGDELVVVGVGPSASLATLSLATGETRLLRPLAPGLFPLAVAGGAVVLGRVGESPRLEAIDLVDGATLWSETLPRGPMRVVAADDAAVVLREGPDPDGRFRLAARDPATGERLWSRDFEGAGAVPHVLRTGDRLIASFPAGAEGPLATRLAAVDVATGELVWSRREEGRLERILADAEGRLHVGLRAGVDPAAPGAGYVLSLHRDGLFRWALRRTTVAGPGAAPLLDGPALAGRDRLLLVAAELLEGSTGATVGRAPFPAPAAFRVAGRAAFGFVSWTGWYDAALYGLDLDQGRPRFAIRQREEGPHWHLAGTASTTGGSLLAAFSIVDGTCEVAALCELDGAGRAARTLRLADPPDGGSVVGSFAAGDRWIEVIEVARPWPDGPHVELRAFALDGFSPPEAPRPLGTCSGEVSDSCG